MSDDAKTLLYWAGNSRYCVADDEHYLYCRECARKWAAHIIGMGL